MGFRVRRGCISSQRHAKTSPSTSREDRCPRCCRARKVTCFWILIRAALVGMLVQPETVANRGHGRVCVPPRVGAHLADNSFTTHDDRMIRTRSSRATLLGALADRQSAGISGIHVSTDSRWHLRADEGPLTEERGESPDPPKPTPRPRPPIPETRSRGESQLHQVAGVDPDDTKRRGESPDPPRPTPRPDPPRPRITERGESGFQRVTSLDQGPVTKERGESPTPPETKERGESAGWLAERSV